MMPLRFFGWLQQANGSRVCILYQSLALCPLPCRCDYKWAFIADAVARRENTLEGTYDPYGYLTPRRGSISVFAALNYGCTFGLNRQVAAWWCFFDIRTMLSLATSWPYVGQTLGHIMLARRLAICWPDTWPPTGGQFSQWLLAPRGI